MDDLFRIKPEFNEEVQEWIIKMTIPCAPWQLPGDDIVLEARGKTLEIAV